MIRLVSGNTFTFHIKTETVRWVSEGKVIEDFDFSVMQTTTVTLIRDGEEYGILDCDIANGIIRWHDKGTLPIGTYGLQIVCTDDGGNNYRYYNDKIVKLVFKTKDGSLPQGVEFENGDVNLGVIYIMGAVPVSGAWSRDEMDSDIRESLSLADNSVQKDAFAEAMDRKQDVVQDLESIRSGAGRGTTAVQPSDIADMETKTHASATYQQKEDGKGLSTNDFTTALKEKLNSLSNYDDAEVRGLISGLQTAVDVLSGKDNATDAIDAMNEIVAFLDTFKNSYTLAGILASLKGDIEKWVEGKNYLTQHQDISGKQDTISDLEAIRQGASKGSTALQEHQSLDHLETKQHAEDTYQPKGNYLTQEADPTVPSWAKQPNKPTYTAAEVGALPATDAEKANVKKWLGFEALTIDEYEALTDKNGINFVIPEDYDN